MIHTSELIDHWMMSVELNAISLHWFQIDSSIQFFFVIFRIFLFCQKETFSSPRFCIANRRRTHLTEVRCELVSDSFDQSTNIWAKNRLVIFKAHKYALYSCLEFRFFSWSSYLKKKWNQVKCDGKIDFFV